jgi:glycerophosphoryl diester phosphodiesterase
MTLNRLTYRAVTASLLALFLMATVVVASSFAGGSSHGSSWKPREVKPLVIGHRGASGYRPEHTLGSYALAARMGADFIEPDLVITKDGVLVARHEPEIGGTTDVADHPEFAARKATKNLDGVQVTGWWAEDFTLAELKTLRAKERIPDVRQRNTLYDGRYDVPTLQEVIDLSRKLSKELDRPIGIYPETKHPTYFRQMGLPLEPPLVRTLKRNGLDNKNAKVFVQSFEVGNVKALDKQLDVPIVQLFGGAATRPYDFVVSGDTRTYGDLATNAGLKEISKYADGVGPSKDYIVPRDATGKSLAPTDFVDRAHRYDLKVHPYTFRNENAFLPLELRKGADPTHYGNAFGEFKQFYELGVDGVFTDNTDTAVEAREDL